MFPTLSASSFIQYFLILSFLSRGLYRSKFLTFFWARFWSMSFRGDSDDVFPLSPPLRLKTRENNSLITILIARAHKLLDRVHNHTVHWSLLPTHSLLLCCLPQQLLVIVGLLWLGLFNFWDSYYAFRTFNPIVINVCLPLITFEPLGRFSWNLVQR
jgi:hypothetical protein